MAGSNDIKLQTADVLFERIRAAAESEVDSARLEQLANAFALAAGATGGREKGAPGRIL